MLGDAKHNGGQADAHPHVLKEEPSHEEGARQNGHHGEEHVACPIAWIR